jgi:hypothetical protein
MACEIIWLDQGVLFRNSGTVDMQEVMDANNTMYGDIRYERIKFQISDYTEVTRNLLTGKEAEIIGTLDKSSSVWNTNMLNVVVTKDPEFIPIVKRYFARLSDTNWECRIFGDLQEAYGWIRQKLNRQ